MPLPWEALIPFGVYCTIISMYIELIILYSRLDGHVRRCRYASQRISARTEPGEGRPQFKVMGAIGILRASHLFQPPRYKLDTWDHLMMERDRRLTGHLRGQKVRALRFIHSSDASSQPICLFTYRQTQ